MSAPIFELRVYDVMPGKMPEVLFLFENHLIPLLHDHAMGSVGYWVASAGSGVVAEAATKLYYLVTHEGDRAPSTHWDRLHADSRWHAAIAAVEKGTRFVLNVESTLLQATSFSPIKGADEQATKVARNLATAKRFLDRFFNAKDVSVADEFLAPSYIQHNPGVADGVEPLKQFGRGLFAKFPKLTFTPLRTVAEGEYVVVHSHLKAEPRAVGSVVADVYRFENGKIAEHWDVLQDIPAAAANGNGML